MFLSQQCCYYCLLRHEQSLNFTYWLRIIITMIGSSILGGGGGSGGGAAASVVV